MKQVHKSLFEQIISIENLLLAWQEFKKDKRQKGDVQIFERELEDNLYKLHGQLKSGYYRHQAYKSFTITDPKQRLIHKATVRDRIVHHAIFRILYDLFDSSLIYDSYSCRVEKGTHKAVERVSTFCRNVSRNYKKPCFVLKCDIRKFFPSIDHQILKEIVFRKVKDAQAQQLISIIIDSFKTLSSGSARPIGLPIGNLTSQLFANVYLDVFDKFIKYNLKVRHYARYTDDFVIVSRDLDYLKSLIGRIQAFLSLSLRLELHPKKIVLRPLSQGIDFLGYVILPYHRVLRTKSKRRMFKKLNVKVRKYEAGELSQKKLNQSVQSYFGVLKHCNSRELKSGVRRTVSQ